MTAIVKIIEVRDVATCMPCLAIQPNPQTEAEVWAFSRTGYGLEPSDHRQYVLMVPLNPGQGIMTADPYCQPGAPERRTMFEAHRYVIKHWDELSSGDVVDVEYIMGETEEPKRPDRYYKMGG